MENKQRVEETGLAAVIGSIAAGKNELASYLGNQHAVTAVEVGQFVRRLAKTAAEDRDAVLPFRSNIPEISRFVFSQVDEDYSNRAQKHQDEGHFVVAGENHSRDETYVVEHDLSDRQVEIVLVGGQINAFRKRR